MAVWPNDVLLLAVRSKDSVVAVVPPGETYRHGGLDLRNGRLDGLHWLDWRFVVQATLRVHGIGVCRSLD